MVNCHCGENYIPLKNLPKRPVREADMRLAIALLAVVLSSYNAELTECFPGDWRFFHSLIMNSAGFPLALERLISLEGGNPNLWSALAAAHFKDAIVLPKEPTYDSCFQMDVDLALPGVFALDILEYLFPLGSNFPTALNDEPNPIFKHREDVRNLFLHSILSIALARDTKTSRLLKANSLLVSGLRDEAIDLLCTDPDTFSVTLKQGSKPFTLSTETKWEILLLLRVCGAAKLVAAIPSGVPRKFKPLVKTFLSQMKNGELLVHTRDGGYIETAIPYDSDMLSKNIIGQPRFLDMVNLFLREFNHDDHQITIDQYSLKVFSKISGTRFSPEFDIPYTVYTGNSSGGIAPAMLMQLYSPLGTPGKVSILTGSNLIPYASRNISLSLLSTDLLVMDFRTQYIGSSIEMEFPLISTAFTSWYYRDTLRWPEKEHSIPYIKELLRRIESLGGEQFDL